MENPIVLRPELEEVNLREVLEDMPANIVIDSRSSHLEGKFPIVLVRTLSETYKYYLTPVCTQKYEVRIKDKTICQVERDDENNPRIVYDHGGIKYHFMLTNVNGIFRCQSHPMARLNQFVPQRR